MTHKELVKTGAKWLKTHPSNAVIPNCNTIASELTAATPTGEIPDIIGWCSWTSILIEVKVSRSDFLIDKQKDFREWPHIGMGEFRYFLCPEGLIKEHEVQDDWGLLYLNDHGKIEVIKLAKSQELNHKCEKTVLLSIIRRSK